MQSFLVASCLTAVSALEIRPQDLESLGWTPRDRVIFDSWLAQNPRTYSSEFELIYRMDIFMKNKRKIDLHNSNPIADRWGLNSFSDQHPDELMQRLLIKSDFDESGEWRYFQRDDLGQILAQQAATPKALPKAIDWKKYMTPPRQQGFCGSCWAFASADAIISRLVIKKKVKKLKPLSVSHLMDCVPNQMGCEGGNLGPVFEHIRDKGGLYEEDYRPYDETVKNCAKATGSVGKKQYKSIVSLKFPSVAELEAALQSGPVAVLIAVHENWFYYKSGQLDLCSYRIDKGYYHSVVIFGYDSISWHAKNSWGTSWGENGYFLMPKNIPSECENKLRRIVYQA